MANRVFVSSNFNDRVLVNNIKNMISQSTYYDDYYNEGYDEPWEGEAIFVKYVASQHPADIDREINRVMNSCDAVLFVVGDNSHNSPWINREVELAISKKVPIIVTHLPHTTGNIPNTLKGKNYIIANWSPEELGEALFYN